MEAVVCRTKHVLITLSNTSRPYSAAALPEAYRVFVATNEIASINFDDPQTMHDL